MKTRINQDKCIGCGNCVALTESKVFDFNDEGLAESVVDIVPEELKEITKEAVDECPTQAIEEISEEEK